MNKRRGNGLIMAGLLLLAAALALTVYNMQTELNAGESSSQVLGTLTGLLPASPAAAGQTPAPGETLLPGQTPASGQTPAPGETLLPGQTPAPGQTLAPGETLLPGDAFLPGCTPTPTPEPVPDYILYPEMEMPLVEVDGHEYIGTLSIPDLGLELPVMSRWSYPKLKLSPCRFSGSAYLDNLIIVAHNYVTHLGNIRNLPTGTPITFVDMAGNVFCYQLAEIEILKPHQVEELMGTDYALSLVTCTVGGRTRVTARCEKVGEIPAPAAPHAMGEAAEQDDGAADAAAGETDGAAEEEAAR